MEEDFYRFDGNIFVTKKSTRFQMHISFFHRFLSPPKSSIFRYDKTHEDLMSNGHI